MITRLLVGAACAALLGTAVPVSAATTPELPGVAISPSASQAVDSFYASRHGAPLLVAQIKDLLQRYVIAPANPLWPSRWAQIYDREGTPRYAINLIHVASNQIGSSEAEHALFALSFDLVV